MEGGAGREVGEAVGGWCWQKGWWSGIDREVEGVMGVWCWQRDRERDVGCLERLCGKH